MKRARIAPLLAIGVLASAPIAQAQQAAPRPAPAQAQAQRFESLKDLHDSYRKQFESLESKRIDDLTALAARLDGEDAASAYGELFNLAIASGRHERAEKAATAYLDRKATDPELRDLAGMTLVLAHADRDEYDKAGKAVDAFLAREHRAESAYAIGEMLLNRLNRAGKPDLASKISGRFVANTKSEDVRKHFQARADRLAMVGKDAPAINGSDPDGQKVALNDLKGKVVLVDFFATWCPPCVAAVPQYQQIRKKYRDKGFEILGVSLDGARAKANRDEVASQLNQFLVEYRVGWPIVLGGTGNQDFAKAYGVTEIPATFLVDAKGKVTAVDLGPQDLEATIAKALGMEPTAAPDVKAAEPAQPKAAVPAKPARRP